MPAKNDGEKAVEAVEAVEAYIEGFGTPTRTRLKAIRKMIAEMAPGAKEVISYGIPTFKRERIIIHYAGFKGHIGMFPPVRGDAKLVEALKGYAGPKGNLRFPLEEKLPVALIKRVIKHHIKREAAESGGE